MPKKYLNLIKCTKMNRNKLKLSGSLKKLSNELKSNLFADPKLLHTIQMSNLFKDSKTFVDMVAKGSNVEVLANFDKLGESPSVEDLRKFIDENFHDVGHDLVVIQPRDWYENAPFLTHVTDEKLLNFGKFLNSKWKMLLRNFDNKHSSKSSTTAIQTKNSFIVPGGRFIEYYYWDTFWIVEGLLASGMIQTARGIIENFADIIKLAGFVPNGSRVYYMNRSQPPLLTQMVYSYYKLTGDSGLVEETLDQLDKEYEFWMARKCVRVVIDGERYKLNMYNVNGSHPRPESYREDFDNANQSNNREMYFSNIMSATESGWDFSSRWFSDPMDIKTIQITNIIPIDLNAIMYCNEVILAEFHRLLGTRKAKSYEQAASKRQKVINTLLWDKKVLSWGDYNILTKKVNSSYLYISDLSPLWSGIEPPVDANIILTRYQSLLMDHVSGIPASNIKSGQQWDFPNVWAPYHFWAVDYFRKINRFDIALNIAQRFVNTVYQGWHKTNYIFEKYEADTAGAYGGGGEYVVQEGFGWTNGVVIKFIEWFGDELKLEPFVDPVTLPMANEIKSEEEEQQISESLLTKNETLTNESVSSSDVSSSMSFVSNQQDNSQDQSSVSLLSTEQEVKKALPESISNEIAISIQSMEI